MTTVWLALAGTALGAILGSFLATLCLRWPEGRSVLVGRSACDGCGRQLGALELVPLVSGLALGSTTRCCGSAIAPLHRQVELMAAFIGGGSLAVGGLSQGLALAVFGWLLLPLAVLDARHFWLPDRLVLLLGLCGLAGGAVLTSEPLLDRFVAALAAGLGLAGVALGYRLLRGRQGLGAGDPKLIAAIALWLGPFLTASTFLAACLIGLVEALVRRRGPADPVPLGLFFAIGAWAIAASAVGART